MVRRFYWEVVALRQAGLSAAGLLADPALSPALALVGAACDEPLRVACVVELSADRAVDVASLRRARDALHRHGIALDLWPQLSSADGRFLNTRTAATVQALLLPLLDQLHDDDGIGLALDLEPDESLARAAWSLRAPDATLWQRARALGAVAGGVGRAALRAAQGRRDLVELARDLRARALPVHVAVVPPFSASPWRDALRTWALGCPAVDDDGHALFSAQAAMCYAPLLRRLPGSRGRDDEKRALALWAARHKVSFDAVIVGMTATGILGDEPVYDEPKHLAEDVRAMQALGFTDVAVYALEGLLFGPRGAPTMQWALRRDAEQWVAAAVGVS